MPIMSPETCVELIEKWDRGETIWSLELGGMGPGYEQAIQVAAVEFLRSALEQNYKPPDPKDDPDNDLLNKQWDELCNAALKPIDEKLGGLTGAMYGQAKWLSWQWYKRGPAGFERLARTKGEEDRLIQVSKAWPKA
jgi:hypothetical protein